MPRGFSLLEIMITLLIISMLMYFSIPSYARYIAHAKRLEAEIALTKLASEMEHYFIKNNTYQNVTLEKLGVAATTHNNQYQLIIQFASRSNFVISAKPLKVQDPLCGTLTLNALGEKSSDGTGRKNDCWQ